MIFGLCFSHSLRDLWNITQIIDLGTRLGPLERLSGVYRCVSSPKGARIRASDRSDLMASHQQQCPLPLSRHVSGLKKIIWRVRPSVRIARNRVRGCHIVKFQVFIQY